MPQQNMEAIKAPLPGPETDLARLFRDTDLIAGVREESESLFDPDFEAVSLYPGGTVYRGVDGLRDLWLDILEPWESYRFQVESLRIRRGHAPCATNPT